MLIGFADEIGGRYRDCLMFQRNQKFDEQDVALGMDQIYIERDDQSRGGYGTIAAFLLHRDSISVKLAPEMAQKLGDAEFEIRFMLEDARFEALREGLQTLFHGFGNFQEG